MSPPLSKSSSTSNTKFIIISLLVLIAIAIIFSSSSSFAPSSSSQSKSNIKNTNDNDEKPQKSEVASSGDTRPPKKKVDNYSPPITTSVENPELSVQQHQEEEERQRQQMKRRNRDGELSIKERQKNSHDNQPVPPPPPLVVADHGSSSSNDGPTHIGGGDAEPHPPVEENNNQKHDPRLHVDKKLMDQIFGNETLPVNMKHELGLTDEPNHKEDVLRNAAVPPELTPNVGSMYEKTDNPNPTAKDEEAEKRREKALEEEMNKTATEEPIDPVHIDGNNNNKSSRGLTLPPLSPTSSSLSDNDYNDTSIQFATTTTTSTNTMMPSRKNPTIPRLTSTSTTRNPNLRIGIVTFVTYKPDASQRSFNEELSVFFHKLSWINKKSYADRWGYDYILENATSIMKGDDRPAPFGKIKAIMKWLPFYDYIMWIDNDALIMNFDVTIESILVHSASSAASSSSSSSEVGKRQRMMQQYNQEKLKKREDLKMMYRQNDGGKRSPEEIAALIKKLEAVWAKEDEEQRAFEHTNNMTGTSVDLMMTRDWNGINSGVFFLRNSDWSMDFLKRVDRGLTTQECPLNENWWEQRVMMCLFDEKLAAGSNWRGRDEFHVMIFDDQRLFNSFGPPTDEGHPGASYKQGDFVVHFPNCKSQTSCSFYFKDHAKKAITINGGEKWYPKKWLLAFKFGTHGKPEHLPTYHYPRRYYNYLKYGNEAALSAAESTLAPIDEEIEELEKKNPLNSNKFLSSPQKKNRELIEKQKRFTMPPRKKYRPGDAEKEKQEEEHEERIKQKKLEREERRKKKQQQQNQEEGDEQQNQQQPSTDTVVSNDETSKDESENKKQSSKPKKARNPAPPRSRESRISDKRKKVLKPINKDEEPGTDKHLQDVINDGDFEEQ